APGELRASLLAQLAALRAFGAVQHVKPHGALYNDAHKDRALAEAIVSVLDPSTAIVAPDASQMAAAARAAGIPVIREAFADRRYEPDGSLTPRSIPGSTLTVEEAAAQAAMLAREGTAIARDGTRIAIPFDTLCIHADMPQAVARLRAIHAAVQSLPT
ncbi:MAG TPA: LamB/YcsF family protein, partial [Thermoanaerobaculia bacterium]|nr:LamB/YcsF family protein [Thermoanaerobaculia bacterium]